MAVKRGFITLAIGAHYCWLAENLVKSYKVFSNHTIPFWVITNQEGEKRLKKFFDGVIVLENYYGTFLDKIWIYNNTKFDETIFIDADSNIVCDISYLFDEFEENGSDVSAISRIVQLNENEEGHLFGRKSVKTFHISQDFLDFNGGVYYFKKSKMADACMDFILNELFPNYSYYELNLCNNGTTMHDEPLMIVGMLKYNMKTIDINKDIMRLVHKPSTVKWDMDSKRVTYKWWDFTVSPDIIHWKTDGTLALKYAHYNAIVSGKYYQMKIFLPFYITWKDWSFLTKYKIYPWLRAHFTMDYIKYTCNRIKRSLKRK